jgi:hypothetical protein
MSAAAPQKTDASGREASMICATGVLLHQALFDWRPLTRRLRAMSCRRLSSSRLRDSSRARLLCSESRTSDRAIVSCKKKWRSLTVSTNARLNKGLNSPRFANWRSQRSTIQSLVKKPTINFQPLKCTSFGPFPARIVLVHPERGRSNGFIKKTLFTSRT